MTRKPGWENRLTEEITAALDRPWSWGDHDCATFAWRCARAVTGGPTRWDKWFGYHHDEDSAKSVLEKNGGLLGMLGREGMVKVPFAMRGDLVAVRDSSVLMGIVDVDGIRVALYPKGVTTVKRENAILAWRV